MLRNKRHTWTASIIESPKRRNCSSSCHGWSHRPHSVLHCIRWVDVGEWMRVCKKDVQTSWRKAERGTSPLESPGTPKWRQGWFCFSPCWAPISLLLQLPERSLLFSSAGISCVVLSDMWFHLRACLSGNGMFQWWAIKLISHAACCLHQTSSHRAVYMLQTLIQQSTQKGHEANITSQHCANHKPMIEIPHQNYYYFFLSCKPFSLGFPKPNFTSCNKCGFRPVRIWWGERGGKREWTAIQQQAKTDLANFS